MFAPSASSTSALPEDEDTERPMCFATFAPAAAATNAAQVETLKVCAPSPPVPQVSTRCRSSFTSTGVASSRITCAAAAISPMVSFFTRRPMMKPAICAGRQLAAHDLAHDVQHLVVEHLAVLDGALDRLGDGDLLHGSCLPCRKFCSILCPCSVSRASGWNCTPSTGRLRWRRPMISPSSDCAVTSRQAGRLARSTTSEW